MAKYKIEVTDECIACGACVAQCDNFEMDGDKAKPKKKGKMFEVGSGGPNSKMKPKGDKIFLEEAALLMRTDYKKYKELLLAGKIDDTVE